MCCEPVLSGDGPWSGTAVLRRAHLDLPCDPASVPAARRMVREQTAGVSGAVADTAVLLASELVTNGVLHGRTALQLGVVRTADLLLVAVGDANPQPPVPRAQDDEATGGRGLLLVSALADDHGVTTHQGGKSVWFLLKDVSGVSQ